MQRDGLFRRLAFSLGGRHYHQQFFTGNLFEFVVAGVHQCHIKVGRQQIITQRFRHTTRIAGLRSGDKRNPGIFRSGTGVTATTPERGFSTPQK